MKKQNLEIGKNYLISGLKYEYTGLTREWYTFVSTENSLGWHLVKYVEPENLNELEIEELA